MDTINLEILEDGTITVKTTSISPGNHMSADNLMDEMEKMMGGKSVWKDNPDAQRKVHDHSHHEAHVGGHSHDGGKTFHKH
jgi:hypothetical protein